MPTRFVVIGGGLAAATAVSELRSLGFDGAIDLVAAEPRRPYERPPLSKGYLTGADDRESVFVHAEGWEAEYDVTPHLGVAARRIAEGRVELDDGTSLAFDQILIATGATPRPLPVPGGDAPGVHTFRTLDDADALRASLAEGGRRVVCVGSGWIGLELAAAARGYGNEVTVVTRSRAPLAAALGDEMGGVFRELHEDHGVTFLLERQVLAIETGSGDSATGVRTDRELVPADVVIVGIGAVPDTELAETAGAAIDGGILVDESMRTSVEGIFAAGDAANAFHPVLGARLRSEHWANAIASGKVAAASMLGRDAALDDVPYFFTDQYDLGMEYSGYAPLADDAEVVVRGDRRSGEFIAFWVQGDRVVAGMNVNIWDVQDQVQRLIRDRVAVDRTQLADSAIDLASIA